MSRIVNREFIFGAEEQEYFRKSMRDLETFSGVRVLTYCIMSNHFHLLLQIPEAESPDDDELFRRMRAIYSKVTVANFKNELMEARERCDEEEVERLRGRFIYRMNDLSMFLKDLKQKFTQWYNRRVNRRGILWEERFKSILVEGSQHALLTMASYIDLNRPGEAEPPPRIVRVIAATGEPEARAASERFARLFIESEQIARRYASGIPRTGGSWRTLPGRDRQMNQGWGALLARDAQRFVDRRAVAIVGAHPVAARGVPVAVLAPVR